MDFLEKGCKITEQYYSELLNPLNEKLKETQPHLAKKKVIFYHEIAPVHSSGIVVAKLHELCYELLLHLPYSLDLAPYDFFLFPEMNTWFPGKKFSSNEEIIVETGVYFNESYFLEGLKKWLGHWEKCIALKGNYVDPLSYFGHKHVETGPNCSHELATFLKYHVPSRLRQGILNKIF